METDAVAVQVDGFTTSPEVGDLMMALAKAQAAMENPDEDSDNPYFNSRYASLGAVINATLPHLNEHGIAVTQFGTANLRDKSYTCTTVFWLGAQFLQWRLTLPVIKTSKRGDAPDSRGEVNKQDYAGVNTYARRIMLMGMAGVAGEPDDDGNDAATPGSEKPRQDPGKQRPEAKRPEPGHMIAPTPDPVEEDPRTPLLRAISAGLVKAVNPLNHAGMHQAVLYHCFEANRQTIRQKPFAVLEAGMPLFAHLCDELYAQRWGRSQHPDEWIASEQRKLAAQARGDAPLTEEVTTEDEASTGASWGPERPNLMQEEEEDAVRDKEDALIGEGRHWDD